MLNVLRRLSLLALCWICSIPGKVSMLLWYCIQGKDMFTSHQVKNHLTEYKTEIFLVGAPGRKTRKR